jgi:hypothetical protein
MGDPCRNAKRSFDETRFDMKRWMLGDLGNLRVASTTLSATRSSATTLRSRTLLGRTLLGTALLATMLLATTPFISAVSAQVPAGMTVDDGFTYFDLENFAESVDGRPVHRGWALQSEFRVFGAVAPRSALKFVVKRGNQVLGENVCEVRMQHHFENVATGQQNFYVSQCKDRQQRIDADGALSVEVHLIDDATDQVTLLRTHTIHVRTTSTVGGNGQATADLRYVDRNGEMLTAVAHLQNREAGTYWLRGQGYASQNVMTLAINYHSYERRNTSQTRLRCTVDGERITIPSDGVTMTELRVSSATHTFGSGQRDDSEHVYYRQALLHLPVSFESSAITPTHARWRPADPRFDTTRVYLDAHPGRWECEWRDGQTALRVFRWTVGADGKLVPHPEQSAGLTLGLNAFLIETEVPTPPSDLDTRAHRDSVARNAFYGLGWRSEEGRANAARAPNIGRAELPYVRAGRAPTKNRRRR